MTWIRNVVATETLLTIRDDLSLEVLLLFDASSVVPEASNSCSNVSAPSPKFRVSTTSFPGGEATVYQS